MSDAIIGVTVVIGLQIVAIAYGYGKLSNKVDGVVSQLPKESTKFADACSSLSKDLRGLGERIACLEGMIRDGGSHCGKEEVVDSNSSQESQPVLRSN